METQAGRGWLAFAKSVFKVLCQSRGLLGLLASKHCSMESSGTVPCTANLVKYSPDSSLCPSLAEEPVRSGHRPLKGLWKGTQTQSGMDRLRLVELNRVV